MSVLVLGSINMDLVVKGPRLPSPGETVLGGEFYQALGGKGANQAVAAGRAGREPVTFLAAVGEDAFGQAALDTLSAERLDLSCVKKCALVPTGIALIMVDVAGENAISVASGANALVTADDVDAATDEMFARARVFLACLESPLAAVRRAFARAKDNGLLTVLNPAPADRAILDGDLLSLVDVITPNELEAEALTAIRVIDSAAAADAGRALKSLGAGAAIITLGKQGCVVVDEDAVEIPAQQVKAVDSTAAGDSFNGALAVALVEGRTLSEAAAWANAAAAICVTRAGAIPSLPTRDEIEAAIY